MGSGYFGGIYFAQYATQFAAGEVPVTEIPGTYEPIIAITGAFEVMQNLPGSYEPTLTLDGTWED